MSQVNDDKHCSLLQLTGQTSGTISDMANAWLSAETGLTGTTNDLWMAYWDQQLIPPGNFNDRAYEWMQILGYTSDQMNDLWHELWHDICLNGAGPSLDIVVAFPLTSSLIGQVDNVESVGNFARAAGPSTVEDFEGVIHNCLDGEARFWKARRVENILPKSNDIQDPAWATSSGAALVSPTEFTFTSGQNSSINQGIGDRIPEAGLVSVFRVICTSDIDVDARLVFRDVDGQFEDTNFPLTAGVPYLAKAIGNPIGASGDGYWQVQVVSPSSDGLLTVTEMQSEIVTGTQTESSEYVSVGVEADPWHGANVDGVKYFGTDRSGNPLSDMRGCLVEAESTNHIPGSTDFSTWNEIQNSTVGTNLITLGDITLRDITGGDGAGGSRIEDTATAINALTGNQITLSAFVKQKDVGANPSILVTTTEVSQLQITFDGSGVPILNSAGTEFDSGSAFSVDHGNGIYQLGYTITLVADSADIKMGLYPSVATSKDTYFGAPQLELLPHVSTYIPTEAVAETRPAEALNVARPILTDEQWNNLNMALRTYTVSDNANLNSSAASMYIKGADGDNYLRIGNNLSTNEFFRKRAVAISYDAAVPTDHLSKARDHLARISSDTGVHYSLNDVSDNNVDVTPIVTLNDGDGVVHLGTDAAGGISTFVNAGISAVYISPITT